MIANSCDKFRVFNAANCEAYETGVLTLSVGWGNFNYCVNTMKIMRMKSLCMDPEVEINRSLTNHLSCWLFYEEKLHHKEFWIWVLGPTVYLVFIDSFAYTTASAETFRFWEFLKQHSFLLNARGSWFNVNINLTSTHKENKQRWYSSILKHGRSFLMFSVLLILKHLPVLLIWVSWDMQHKWNNHIFVKSNHLGISLWVRWREQLLLFPI